MHSNNINLLELWSFEHEYKGQLQREFNIYSRGEELARQQGMNKKKFVEQLLGDMLLVS